MLRAKEKIPKNIKEKLRGRKLYTKALKSTKESEDKRFEEYIENYTKEVVSS